MNHQERFQKAFEHRCPDRCPIDYLAHPETNRRLKAHLGVETEEELLGQLGCDFYYLSCRDISQNESYFPIYQGPALRVTEAERTCPFKIRWRRQVYNAKFAVDEPIEGPLEKATSPKDVLSHEWPKVEHFDFSRFHEECEVHADRVIIGGFWSGILGDCFRMHGFEHFLMNMVANQELIKTLIDRMTEFYLELNDRLFSELKGKIDIWFFGNDFGSQNGLLFSEHLWGDYFFENIKKLCALARGYSLKVMMHSCGSIAPLIPSLLEAGVEILDPIQTSAAGMDPGVLKGRFGDRLVFHGAVDTQRVLPQESPEGVYRHATEMIRILGDQGGYIFAPSQILQPDVPVENIVAMYRAARETACR